MSTKDNTNSSNIPIVKIMDRNAQLDSIRDKVKFGVSFTEKSEKIDFEGTFDYNGLTIKELLIFARRAIIVALQGKWRREAENDADFAERMKKRQGAIIKVAEAVKAETRQVNKEKIKEDVKKKVKKLREAGMSREDILKLLEDNDV